jgi:hypothetical protein
MPSQTYVILLSSPTTIPTALRSSFGFVHSLLGYPETMVQPDVSFRRLVSRTRLLLEAKGDGFASRGSVEPLRCKSALLLPLLLLYTRFNTRGAPFCKGCQRAIGTDGCVFTGNCECRIHASAGPISVLLLLHERHVRYVWNASWGGC